MYLGECHKTQYGHHFYRKETRKNCLHKLFTLFIINIQLNELVEKLANK